MMKVMGMHTTTLIIYALLSFHQISFPDGVKVQTKKTAVLHHCTFFSLRGNQIGGRVMMMGLAEGMSSRVVFIFHGLFQSRARGRTPGKHKLNEIFFLYHSLKMRMT